MRVAVVGATGAVGSTMLEVLRERAFPAGELVPFASERSAGRTIDYGDADLKVEALSDDAIQGFDLALLSAGSTISGEWAPKLAEAGAVAVDNSSRWRMEDDVPLVVSEVNPDDLDSHRGIVANPNCSTMQMVVALKPIDVVAGIERLVITTMQSVSGTGQKAVEELHDQTEAALGAKEIPPPQAYAHQIAFNVLPHAGKFPEGSDYTDEELKLVNETRKILGKPDIAVSATCTRVPVYTSHSESVNVQTRDPLSADDCRALLSRSPGLTVLDEPANAVYPQALDAAGRDDVLVGRIRQDPSHPRALNLFVVADNLRKGAATNAVQLAELLAERRLLRGSAPQAA